MTKSNAQGRPPEDMFMDAYIMDVILSGMDLVSALGETITLVSEYQRKLARILGGPDAGEPAEV